LAGYNNSILAQQQSHLKQNKWVKESKKRGESNKSFDLAQQEGAKLPWQKQQQERTTPEELTPELTASFRP